MKKIIVPLVVVFLMASLLSCAGKKEANRKTDADVQGKVLATVNGVPITEYDVNLNLKRVVHGEEVTPEATQNVLQALVRNELIYQQSLELGLDNNPEYRRKLSEVEAQLRDYKRKEMSALYREYVKSQGGGDGFGGQGVFRKEFEKNPDKSSSGADLLQGRGGPDRRGL